MAATGICSNLSRTMFLLCSKSPAAPATPEIKPSSSPWPPRPFTWSSIFLTFQLYPWPRFSHSPCPEAPVPLWPSPAHTHAHSKALLGTLPRCPCYLCLTSAVSSQWLFPTAFLGCPPLSFTLSFYLTCRLHSCFSMPVLRPSHWLCALGG